jgi:Flp pilus assembly protein TadD
LRITRSGSGSEALFVKTRANAAHPFAMRFRYSRTILDAMAEDTPERAHSLARSGDMRGAAQTLTRYLQTAPGDASAHFRLAQLMLELGDASAAVQSFQHALAIEPDNAVIHSDLGTALEALGEEAQAAEAYGRAVRAVPCFPPAYYNLALILCRRSEWQQAAELLREALAQSPDFRAARHQLGLVLIALGQEHAGRRCFDELLADDSEDLEAHLAVADLDMKRCQFTGAVEHLGHCLAVAPNDARVILSFGSCLQELGRVDEALTHYRALLKREPSRYYDVVKKLTSASRGRFWLKSSELRRVLLG